MIFLDAARVYTVICDKCGHRDFRWRSSRRAVVASLKRDGWRVFRGKELTSDRWAWRHRCPECSKRN